MKKYSCSVVNTHTVILITQKYLNARVKKVMLSHHSHDVSKRKTVLKQPTEHKYTTFNKNTFIHWMNKII